MNRQIQCDRCGKLVNGTIDKYQNKTITGGYYIVSEGYWQKYQRWEEFNVCDACIHSDLKYKREYNEFKS